MKKFVTIQEATLEAWAKEFFPHLTLSCGRECVLASIAAFEGIEREDVRVAR